MINAKKVEHGRVEVVHMDATVDDVVGQLVGLAVGDTRFDTATGHPVSEAVRMVVAPAFVLLADAALHVAGPSEFAAPNDQRVLEHVPLFEIGDERGGGLVNFPCVDGKIALHAAVLIPTGVKELDELHTALSQSAGLDAVGGKGAGRL